MELQLYDDSFYEMCRGYRLMKEQLTYAHLPAVALAHADSDLSRHPVLGIENKALACFFILHEGEGPKPYTNNEKAALIRSFSTDARFQRMGCGERALKGLPDFMGKYFPHIDEIVLAVNVKNPGAKRLYLSVGFQDTGKRMMGSNGSLIILKQML